MQRFSLCANFARIIRFSAVLGDAFHHMDRTNVPVHYSFKKGFYVELELELILSQMAQKPMLRGEVGARALRVRSDVRGHG